MHAVTLHGGLTAASLLADILEKRYPTPFSRQIGNCRCLQHGVADKTFIAVFTHPDKSMPSANPAKKH